MHPKAKEEMTMVLNSRAQGHDGSVDALRPEKHGARPCKLKFRFAEQSC